MAKIEQNIIYKLLSTFNEIKYINAFSDHYYYLNSLKIRKNELEERISTLTFNLKIECEAEKLKAYGMNAVSFGASKMLKFFADKSVQALMNAAVTVPIAAFGFDPQCSSKMVDHVVTPFVNQTFASGIKQNINSCIQFFGSVAKSYGADSILDTPSIVFAEKNVLELEKNGELKAIIFDIKKDILNTKNFIPHFSINPLEVGFLKAFQHIIFRISLLVSTFFESGFCNRSQGELIEECINWHLEKHGLEKIQFERIAKRLSMKDLTLKRYHHKATTVLQHTENIGNAFDEMSASF